MQVSLFDFELPHELIANEPANPRDSARLLHITPNALYDRTVTDLPTLLREDDVLVFNDTKVIPARLYGQRGQAAIEATLLQQLALDTWSCLIKNARRLHPGDTITFATDFTATVKEKLPNGPVVLIFNQSGPDLFEAFHKYGIMPLPPYIKRASTNKDKADYQTIYAQHEGAVAAPTAGLHFTPNLMSALENKGIERHFITLHVGGGTFLPVKVADTKDHIMHAEYGIIDQKTADALTQAKQQKRRIVAVGTTTLRLLESATDATGKVHPFAQNTSIFITPGYQFKCVDALWTNFHLPQSTLFMLVCAFAGTERMKTAYAHAIQNKYRFFSYGDATFIEP